VAGHGPRFVRGEVADETLGKVRPELADDLGEDLRCLLAEDADRSRSTVIFSAAAVKSLTRSMILATRSATATLAMTSARPAVRKDRAIPPISISAIWTQMSTISSLILSISSA
jgi:hypothetical protein